MHFQIYANLVLDSVGYEISVIEPIGGRPLTVLE